MPKCLLPLFLEILEDSVKKNSNGIKEKHTKAIIKETGSLCCQTGDRGRGCQMQALGLCSTFISTTVWDVGNPSAVPGALGFFLLQCSPGGQVWRKASLSLQTVLRTLSYQTGSPNQMGSSTCGSARGRHHWGDRYKVRQIRVNVDERNLKRRNLSF